MYYNIYTLNSVFGNHDRLLTEIHKNKNKLGKAVKGEDRYNIVSDGQG